MAHLDKEIIEGPIMEGGPAGETLPPDEETLPPVSGPQPYTAKHEEPGRPFRLVKYFSVTGFLVILFFSLFLSLFISTQARDLIQKKSDDYARLLADNLNHQVFLQFVLPVARTYGRIRLSDAYQFSLLDAVVSSTIHGFNVQRVDLYDLEGKIIYSTDPSVVDTEVKDVTPYLQARDGQKSSLLLTGSDDGITLLDRTYTLRTFFPFRGEKFSQGPVGDIIGVFEVYQDLTEEYEDITRFQILMVGFSLAFTAVLFLVLRIILARGERIIEQRNEERRRLEEKLHHSERLATLGQMVAGVAHEIRNPLGIISSTAEILQNKIKTYEPKNHLAGVIVEESRRLNNIVTEFLDFARPQTPGFKPVMIEAILEENIEFLTLDLEKNGIEIVRSYKEPDLIDADPDLLYRAFLNIFLNAMQAMPDGGVIHVSTSLPYAPNGRGLGMVEVVVADTGYGVDPDKADKLFTPFFTTKNRGSGLGLAIVRNTIEAHQGTVAMEPVEGGGTKVVIRIPVKQV